MHASRKNKKVSKKPLDYQQVATRSFSQLLRELDKLVPLVEQAQVVTSLAREALRDADTPSEFITILRRDKTVRFLSSVLKHGDMLRDSAQLYRAELESLAKVR